MFCPKCKAEYREGFTECADCNIPLVADLQEAPEQPPGEYDYVEVLTASNQDDIATFKLILESAEIPYVVHGDYISTTVSSGLPVRFLVPEESVDEAKETLKDFL